MNERDWVGQGATSLRETWKRAFDYRGAASRFDLACWLVFCAAAGLLAATFIPGFLDGGSVFWRWLMIFFSTYARNWVPADWVDPMSLRASAPFLAFCLLLAPPGISLFARRLRDAAHSPWHAAWFPLLAVLWSWFEYQLADDCSLPESAWMPWLNVVCSRLLSLARAGAILAAIYLCAKHGSGNEVPAPLSRRGIFASLRHSCSLYACFRGRASRREWWICLTTYYLLLTAAAALYLLANRYSLGRWAVPLLSVPEVWLTPWLWSVSVRRLHDVGYGARAFAVWLSIPCFVKWGELALWPWIQKYQENASVSESLWMQTLLFCLVTLIVWGPAWIVGSRKAIPA